MDIGILVGMFLFGVLALLSNLGGTQISALTRLVAYAFILVGACGAIGAVIGSFA